MGGLSPPPGLRLIPCYLSFTPLLSQVVFSIAAGKRALGYGPARPENWGLTRRRRPAAPAFAAEDGLQDAPSLKWCLQLTSCLEGSIEKLMQPSRGQGWCGFSSVCKRPLEVRVADGTRAARHDGRSARGRYAFLIC